jgi:hypothetical protein
VAVIGDLLEGTSVGDVASGLGGVDGPEPAASAESTKHGNPQSPGWTKRYAQFVNSVVVFVCSSERVG